MQVLLHGAEYTFDCAEVDNLLEPLAINQNAIAVITIINCPLKCQCTPVQYMYAIIMRINISL